jgi:hypothetical protein
MADQHLQEDDTTAFRAMGSITDVLTPATPVLEPNRTCRGRFDRLDGNGQQPIATAAAEPIPERRTALRRARMRSFLGSTVLPIRTTEAP